MNRFFSFCFLLFLFTIVVGSRAQEENFEAAYESTSTKFHHGSLALEISLPKKSFFLGELIPVTFRFVDLNNTGRYTVWTGGYDRSGRIGSVSFFVDAGEEKVKDPLAVYFDGGIFMGGGIGNTHELGQFEQVFDLNEWVRFDQPGNYRFYATSRRVSEKMEDKTKSAALASSIVEIEIREPKAEELEMAFENAEAAYTPDDYQARERTIKALSQLRFLDSKKSRLRLRGLLGEADGGSFAAMFGLIGTRDVDTTILLLEKGIQDPEVPITQNYLNALSKLRVTGKFYEQTPEEREKTRFGRGSGFTNHLGAPADWNSLLNSFSAKQKRAKAVCALSIFQLIIGEQRQAKSFEENAKKGVLSIGRENKTILDHEEALEKIREPLAGVFTELKPEEKERLLNDCWELIKCPTMVEPLQEIVETPLKRKENAWSNGLHSWALLRYAEMKPELAHPIILEEVRKPQPMYSLPALRLLPDKLEQSDLNLLVSNLSIQGNDVERIAGLIEYYGDESISEPVKEFYLAKEGRWACAIQSYFLKYLIRIDRAEGLDLSFHALNLREKTRCYSSSVIDVLKDSYDEDIETRVAGALTAEREPDVIVNFARLLKEHPSLLLADAILTQLERLDPVSDDHDYSYDTEAGAHKELRTILLRKAGPDVWLNDGQQWFLNPEQMARLKAELETDSERKQLEEIQ